MKAPEKKPKLYFAHPISSYGTAQETRVIEKLETMGYEVVNPNDAVHQERVRVLKTEFGRAAGERIMEYFVDVCNTCDASAIMAFPNGQFDAGVVKEANSFFARGKTVLNVTVTDTITVDKMVSLPQSRCLNVDETRAELRARGTPGYGTP